MASIWPELNEFANDISVATTVEAECFYGKQLQTQGRDIQAYKRDLEIELSPDFPYSELTSTSFLFFLFFIILIFKF